MTSYIQHRYKGRAIFESLNLQENAREFESACCPCTMFARIYVVRQSNISLVITLPTSYVFSVYQNNHFHAHSQLLKYNSLKIIFRCGILFII